MNGSTTPRSFQSYARIAGFLYLMIIVLGLIAQLFVRDRLIDYNDATTTANNIIASEFLFRLGFGAELIMLVCDTAVAMILYVLFRHVNRELNLLSTFFRLVSICVLAVTALTHYAALPILGDAAYLNAFDTRQLNALALLSIKLHGLGYNISLLFFGVHLVLLGYLIVRSGIVPKIFGILITVAGVCYITNTFIWFLFPVFVSVIYPGILIPCFLGELFISLWLLFKGVKTFEVPYRDTSLRET